MSCFTLFTINPGVLSSVFTVQQRESSGKGNIKQSEQYNAEWALLTHLGISSTRCQTHQVAAVFAVLSLHFGIQLDVSYGGVLRNMHSD